MFFHYFWFSARADLSALTLMLHLTQRVYLAFLDCSDIFRLLHLSTTARVCLCYAHSSSCLTVCMLLRLSSDTVPECRVSKMQSLLSKVYRQAMYTLFTKKLLLYYTCIHATVHSGLPTVHLPAFDCVATPSRSSRPSTKQLSGGQQLHNDGTVKSIGSDRVRQSSG